MTFIIDILTIISWAVKSKGVKYIYGIPDPFPTIPSLNEITFEEGNDWISLRELIVATDVQSKMINWNIIRILVL